MDNAQPKTKIFTRKCIFCGKIHQFQVPIEKYIRWRNGAFIQNVFPDLDEDTRELMTSGTCPSCWNKHTKEE